MADKEERVRGLKAVQDHREGRTKMRWPPAKFWGYAGIILALMGIFHYKRTLNDVDRSRTELLNKQRLARNEMDPKWTPLRTKMETWATELAKGPTGDLIEKDALSGWTFRSKKGVYLRLRVEDADSAENIRKAAKDSLRDAFTSCLALVPNANPTAGKECKRSGDCARGEHCNEQDHCSKPAQPYNLRIAYRAFGALSDEWIREVQSANELTLRALHGTFDDLLRDEMPMAADLVREAQYFLLVVDEKAADEPPPSKPGSTGWVNPAETRQALPHFARIGIWRLTDDKPMVRIRREAAGQLLGQSGALDPEVAEARQRQANSCSLALSVRQAIGDTSAAAVPPNE